MAAKGIALMTPVVRPDAVMGLGTVLQFEAVRSFSFHYGRMFQSEIVAGKIGV